MPQFILLTSQFNVSRGGFEATVMVQNDANKHSYDCFVQIDENAPDHSVIKGLLADAKRQHADADQHSIVGFPMSPNQVRLIRSA